MWVSPAYPYLSSLFYLLCLWTLGILSVFSTSMSFHIFCCCAVLPGEITLREWGDTLTKSPGCWFLSGQETLESGLLRWGNCRQTGRKTSENQRYKRKITQKTQHQRSGSVHSPESSSVEHATKNVSGLKLPRSSALWGQKSRHTHHLTQFTAPLTWNNWIMLPFRTLQMCHKYEEFGGRKKNRIPLFYSHFFYDVSLF